MVWGYKDANGIVVLGAPSERTEVINPNTSAATADTVDITIYVPAGITTEYFYQVYRSGFSADATSVANDELQLVYEDNVTSAEVSAGTITFTDVVDNSLRGATIYTAESQEGIAQANAEPPYAKDMTLYKNHILYANTRTKHILTLTLVSVGSPNGVVVGDTITIAGDTYTFVTEGTETSANGEVGVYLSGTVSQDIANTARSLVKAINLYSSNTDVYAYYTSGYDELPGRISIERRDLTDTSFAAIFTPVASGTPPATSIAWNPPLPTTGTSVSSDNEVKPNRIYVSKVNEPEAVPTLNFLDAGSESGAIQRIIALRDSVFIFKDDNEVYRIVGEDLASFNLQLFDNTVQLYGPKTAQPFQNAIYCFTDQGIAAVSDNSVQVKSWDIERDVIEFLDPVSYPNFETNSFGISYESDRKYILYTGEEQYVFNSFTNSWTRWTNTYQIGFRNPTDDKLYYGDSSGNVWQERKSYDRSDFADDSYDTSVVSYSGTSVTLGSTTNIVAGMTLKQGARESYIASVGSANTVVVEDTILWDTTSSNTISAFTPITCKVQWIPFYGNNAAFMKQFREYTVFFRTLNNNFSVITNTNFNTVVTVTQDFNPATPGAGLAELPLGEGPLGGVDGGPQEHRSYFPLEHQQCMGMEIAVQTDRAFTEMKLNGMNVMFELMATEFNSEIASS
jgi:hypothetical protein